jgi:hypothetical protein
MSTGDRTPSITAEALALWICCLVTAGLPLLMIFIAFSILGA